MYRHVSILVRRSALWHFPSPLNYPKDLSSKFPFKCSNFIVKLITELNDIDLGRNCNKLFYKICIFTLDFPWKFGFSWNLYDISYQHGVAIAKTSHYVIKGADIQVSKWHLVGNLISACPSKLSGLQFQRDEEFLLIMFIFLQDGWTFISRSEFLGWRYILHSHPGHGELWPYETVVW